MLNKEQQMMVEANMGLVIFAVNKYLKDVNIEYDDKISIGYVALCKAVEKYDSNRNEFSTYAIKSIIRNIHREVLPYTRKKRGAECITLSFDKIFEDAEDRKVRETILGYEPDFSDEVIDKVLCEPVWKMCPTHKLLYNSSLSTKQIGSLEGVTSSAILARRKKEFERARSYLNRIGIYDAV